MRFNMMQPSEGVYTRLQPSPIHGVGVFALRPIPKGVKIFSPDDLEIVWIDEGEIVNLPPEVQQMYRDYCIRRNGKLGCPRNFNAMTPSWYLNENTIDPNVVADEAFDFFAARDIKIGEELTVNYHTYSQ